MSRTDSRAGHTAKDYLGDFAAFIEVYEHRVGHVCRAVSKHIPELIKGLPTGPTILDNACGTGAVTETILDAFPAARMYAIDAVPSMVSAAKAVFESTTELKGVEVEVFEMDGEALRFDDNFFDANIMNFGIFFFPNPAKGASEVYRTLKPGGTAVLTLWKSFGFKPILWTVQEIIDPAEPLEELPLMDMWTDGIKLEELLGEAGFQSIKLTDVDEVMWGRGLEDFGKVLVENFDALTARNWTAAERAKLPSVTSQVLENLAPELLVHEGEKVGVKMTAWIAVCKK